MEKPEIRINIEEAYNGYASVSLKDQERSYSVSLTRDNMGIYNPSGKWQVNWSAMGNQYPEVANKYADLIRAAAKLATELDGQAEELGKLYQAHQSLMSMLHKIKEEKK